MFLVTGITGKVGGAAARHLLAHGKQVRALVRDEAKAAEWANQGVELIKGEWADGDAMTRAMQGVEGVYLMVPPTPPSTHDFPEANGAIAGYKKALAATQPAKVVVLSSIGSEKTSGLGLITATHLLEKALKDLPNVAFVRAGSFYENYLYGLQTGQGGTLPSTYTPTDRKLPMIATEDIGAEVAKLLSGAWTGKRVIELGSEVSPDEVAEQLGSVLGRDVKAQAVPREGWRGMLEHAGFPSASMWAYEEMVEGVNSGWIAFGGPGTERVQGTTGAAEVFQAAAKQSQT